MAGRDYEVALLEAESQLATPRTRASELDIARRQLDNTIITTPSTQPGSSESASYAVAHRHVTLGQLMQPGDTMFEVVVDNPLRFRGAVPEWYAGEIEISQPVALTVAGAPSPVDGTVTRIDPTVDAASRTFLIEVTVENAQRRLRPGGFARARVQIGTTEAYRVPAASLVSFAGTSKSFTTSNGKAVGHRVVILQRGDDFLIVEGELGEDQMVITEAASRLADGDEVTVAAADVGSADNG